MCCRSCVLAMCVVVPAIAQAPRDAGFHNAQGIMLQQQRRLEDSLAHFRAALRLDPKFADASHNLALALLKANRPAEALETLEKHPFNTADHHALKGAVFNALARPAEAVAPLRRASALAPGNQDY